jgi:hypothetical protein
VGCQGILPRKMFKVLPHQPVFWLVSTAKFWKTLIIAKKKWRSLDVHIKIEIIHLCEVGSFSKSEMRRQYGLTSLTLFMILKNKQKTRIY